MNPYEEAACEAARRAGEGLRRAFRRGRIEVEVKGLHDYVTEADREAEETIVSYLRGRFPDHEIMAEEGTPDLETEGFRWIVDPLDGTTNFIHGVSTFAVSIALEDPSGLVAAAIYDPFHDETFHAARGEGARLDGEPIRCTELSGLGNALVATGFPFRELSRVDGYLQAFEACLRNAAGLRRAGSASLDLALTACGRYDGFWEIGLSPWDVAAGALLVREAGGIVTDVLGDPDRFLPTGDIVAAGPGLHAALLEITRAAFARGD
ncbi:MAG: inositol monophosphatase family protein [Acidobacteriota bacterium]|nr:inositol monophosphatase family protein [Acidobacteriota bacterium]